MAIGIGIGPSFNKGFSWSSYWATLINTWQGAGSDVYVSGCPVAGWTFINSIPKNAGAQTNAWTILGRAHAIRQNCNIKSITLNPYYLGVAGGVPWEFKLFFWNGTEYECKASQVFQPVGAGVVNNIQSFNLSPVIAAEEGDIPALYMPLKNAVVGGNNADPKQEPSVVMTGSNIVLGDSDAFATDFGAGEGLVNMICLSNRPYSIFLGDSIFGGGNSYDPVGLTECWHTDQENCNGYHTPGGQPGDIDLSVPYRFSTRMPSVFRYQNFGKGGNTFATTISGTQLARAVVADPKVVFIHCGINDVNAGRTTGQVNANLDTIRAAFPVGTVFYMNEILPWQCSDALAATTRAMNANYAAYCTTNGWTLIECHDAMGVVRGSTGELDDLNPIYSNGDSVHLNLVGADMLADIMATYLNL